MELLRRLRFLWACVCLLTALACTAAYFALPIPSTAFFAAAAWALMFIPYLHISVGSRLSTAWVVGGSLLVCAIGWSIGSTFIAKNLALVFGLWILAVVIVWLGAGAKQMFK